MAALTRISIVLFTATALATQLGNGCVSDGDSGGSGGGGGYYEPDQGIPRRARLVEEGRGTIRYRVPEDGQVWLEDRDRRSVIGDYRVRRGREFIVSPSDGRAWIDDERVLSHDFRTGNTHRIYFAPDSGSDGGGGGGGSLPSELRDAQRVAYGRGDLSYVARNAGRVWVYDQTDREVVYRSDVRRDDRLVVSPERNYISLREAGARGSYRLNERHDYALYYKRDDRAADDPDGGGNFDNAGGTVPKSARIMREGRGDLSFVADGVGTAYVYDVKEKTVVSTWRLKRDQRFTVSPANDEAAVDGKRVLRKDLNPNATYRLYFNLDV